MAIPTASPGLGAANVCSLEAASADDALMTALSSSDTDPSKDSDGPSQLSLAVFVTRLLTDAHESIVRAVSAHRAAGHNRPKVTVFSSVSELAHACCHQASNVLGVEAFSEYARLLKMVNHNGREGEGSAA